MSGQPKSLMTNYAEGCLISRELHDMMTDYAAQARFDREMGDDVDFYIDHNSNDRFRTKFDNRS